MDAVYNDIQTWKYKEAVSFFGAKEGEAKIYQLKTKEETNQLFTNKDFNAADVLQFVELYIPRDDAPRALMLTTEAAAKTDARQ